MAKPKKFETGRARPPQRKQKPGENFVSFKAKSLMSRGLVTLLLAGGGAYWHAQVLPGMLAAGSFKKVGVHLGPLNLNASQTFGAVVGLVALFGLKWLVQGVMTYFEERSARGKPSASSWS